MGPPCNQKGLLPLQASPLQARLWTNLAPPPGGAFVCWSCVGFPT